MNARSATPSATFNVDPAETSGTRHAALLLHAMAPADREWVLDALQPPEREKLTTLLAELEALGIERDPKLIAEATAIIVPSSDAANRTGDAWFETPLSDEAWLQCLDAPKVQTLAIQLRNEPAGLVAELLRAGDWPWRDALLNVLEPIQRRRVEAALSESTLAAATPPALRSALINAMAARLRIPTRKREVPTKRWSSWSRTLRQMLATSRFPRGVRP